MRILLPVVLALALVPAVAAAPTQTVALPSLEQSLLVEINAVRADHRRPPLSLSLALRAAARGHSRAMLTHGFFDHRSADGTSMATRVKRRYGARGYTSWSVGENLLTASYTIGAREAVELWLQSPGHRRNLLARDFRHAGIAAVRRHSAPGVFGGEPALVITLDLGSRTRAG